MRVEDKERAERSTSQASFRDALKKQLQKPAPKAAPKPPAKANSAKPDPKAARPAPTASKAGAPQQAALGRSQKATAAFQGKLAERRSEAEVQRPEVREVARKIAAILGEDAPRSRAPEHKPEAAPASTAPTTAANATSSSTAAEAAPTPSAPARAEALADKIEKLLGQVELLAKAEGPALQLALPQGRAARLEVVRTGAGEVTLRLQARTATDRRALAGQVGALRAAMAERGLKVRDVEVR
jgi:hypothetical protein